MSAITIAKTVLVVAIAASRNPAVRAAIKAAPGLLSENQKVAAVHTVKRAAFGAGVMAGRVLSQRRSQ